MIGTTRRDSCKIAVKEMKLPITPEQFDSEFNKMSSVLLRNVQFLPGRRNIRRTAVMKRSSNYV